MRAQEEQLGWNQNTNTGAVPAKRGGASAPPAKEKMCYGAVGAPDNRASRPWVRTRRDARYLNAEFGTIQIGNAECGSFRTAHFALRIWLSGFPLSPSPHRPHSHLLEAQPINNHARMKNGASKKDRVCPCHPAGNQGISAPSSDTFGARNALILYRQGGRIEQLSSARQRALTVTVARAKSEWKSHKRGGECFWVG